MMLVEIILGKKTGDKALATALDFVRAIKKTPIVVNDTRGFYVNRCVLRYISEAYDMLIEGVPAAMIENAATLAGMPVGPLALNDEVAVDLAQKILKADAARPRRQGRRCRADEAHRHAGRYAPAVRAQERQGLLRLSGKAGEEDAVAGPQGPLSAKRRRRTSMSRS